VLMGDIRCIVTAEETYGIYTEILGINMTSGVTWEFSWSQGHRGDGLNVSTSEKVTVGSKI